MENNHVTLVGAGLVGSLLSAGLARRGYRVDVYERRSDMRLGGPIEGRSINLAISTRGLHALREVGLDEEALRMAIPMRGRAIHSVDGGVAFQRYGMDDSQCIYSISRGGLNQLLLSHTEKSGQVKIHFEERVTGADFSRGVLKREKGESPFSVLMGTDGSASAVRTELAQAVRAQVSQTYLRHGYKELTLPAGPGGTFQLEKNALHIWPRGSFMLIALPNLNGSFTATLFLPFEGPVSFDSLQTPQQIETFFREHFQDVVPFFTDLVENFQANPTGSMITVKCEHWSLGNQGLLLGDAAHAIVPFFGQGMNCGFEDCTVLGELLDQRGVGSWQSVFEEFTRLRKTNADAIADMAVENFVEMSDKVGNPRFLLEKEVEKILQKHFPEDYVSRYALVTFSRLPYRFAYRVGTVQSQILGSLCEGLQRPEEVDLNQAGVFIRNQLTPLMREHSVR